MGLGRWGLSYSAVDAQGLVDMDGNKVVISSASTRGERRIGLGRLRRHASDGLNIRGPLAGRQVLPAKRGSLAHGML